MQERLHGLQQRAAFGEWEVKKKKKEDNGCVVLGDFKVLV